MPTEPRPRIVRDRIITQNVWAHAPISIARGVLTTLLDYNPDVVGLQEWPNGRNAVLKEVGPFRKWPAVRRRIHKITRRPWKPQPGYLSVRPATGPTGPVVLRADRYELTRVRAVTLSHAGRVKPTKRHPRAKKPANRATVVETRDHLLGGEPTVFINYHLWAGVQAHGRYSNAASAHDRVVGHRAQVATLNRIIGRYLDDGWTVYAMGDSNFDGLRLRDLTSAWDGREHDRGGTHGHGSHRKIDDVHGPGHAINVDVIWHYNPKVDHAGVLADRERRAAR